MGGCIKERENAIPPCDIYVGKLSQAHLTLIYTFRANSTTILSHCAYLSPEFSIEWALTIGKGAGRVDRTRSLHLINLSIFLSFFSLLFVSSGGPLSRPNIGSPFLSTLESPTPSSVIISVISHIMHSLPFSKEFLATRTYIYIRDQMLGYE